MVLIRTDVNHADLLNESFHVMEVESEGQETGRVYKLRKWDDHAKIVLAHSTALMKASDFCAGPLYKVGRVGEGICDAQYLPNVARLVGRKAIKCTHTSTGDDSSQLSQFEKSKS